MKIKIGLRPKFFMLFFVFIFVLSGILMLVTTRSYKKNIFEKYYDHAISIAKYTSSIMDGDRILEYKNNLEETDQYKADLDYFDNIKLTTGVYYLYVMAPISYNEGIYIFDAALTEEQSKLLDSSASVLGEKVEFDESFSTAIEVLKTGVPSDDLQITTTQQGKAKQTLASAYAPIFDSNGNVVAFVGVDVNMSDVNAFINESNRTLLMVIAAISLICFAVMMIIIQASIIKPIRKLTVAAEKLSAGDYDHEVKVRGNDEISEISRVFNRMAQNIKGHVEEIRTINMAYQKYVPLKFFELLGKEQITDVRLGDQSEEAISVSSFSISKFNDIVKKMSSEEMFHFVNNILQHIVPDVKEENGIVEKFVESGFTALYPENCEEAVKSAVSIAKKMDKLNRYQRFGVDEHVDFSMGITYGSVMVGIIGHDARMSAISISQQTAIAEFLEKTAPKYYSHILVMGSVVSQIPDFDKKYHARCIGFMSIGNSEMIDKLYDVYDGDDEETLRLKELTKDAFERGVSLYCSNMVAEARVEFIEVLKQFRKDLASREYLYLCNQYMEKDEDVDLIIERF